VGTKNKKSAPVTHTSKMGHSEIEEGRVFLIKEIQSNFSDPREQSSLSEQQMDDTLYTTVLIGRGYLGEERLQANSEAALFPRTTAGHLPRQFSGLP
jgi:hypothetical protein